MFLFIFGPLLQFDIAERPFTCIFDFSWFLFGTTEFDFAVLLIFFAFVVWSLIEYYSCSQNVSLFMFYRLEGMLVGIVNRKNFNFLDVVSAGFTVIFLSNFLGLLPYSQTITSQLLFTLVFSMVLVSVVWLQALFFNKMLFFSHFLPNGSPMVIIPFIIVIELVSNISRIISLAVRLFANMTSGHALLKIISGFVLIAFSVSFGSKVIMLAPFFIIILITLLELLIAFLQTYVFITLLLIYVSEQE